MSMMDNLRPITQDKPLQFDVDDSEVKYLDELVRHLNPSPNETRQSSLTKNDLGQITADAIQTSHEEVAKALSVLATELADNVHKIEVLKVNAEKSMKMCLDIADRARERGKQDAEKIAAATQRNDNIRAMIENARKMLED